MSLVRWEPRQEVQTLRNAMNRLFDDSFFGTGSLFDAPFVSTPASVALDVVERDNELMVRAAVPGFEPEQINISVQGNLLTLAGKVEQKSENEKETYHLREYSSRSFHRTLHLPVEVDSDKANAEYKNGILTLHLPKAQASIAKRIPISS